MRDTTKSEASFKAASKVIPGGVNSPVRAFRAVGGVPRFFTHGEGAKIYDADGNSYIDYMMSWGPLILGHAHPKVVEAVHAAASRGTSFGAPTEDEITLAEMVKDRFPAAEMVRLVNSGTEAAMTAVRLARAAAGRDIIVKFDGCYHGHSDAVLVKAGSGVATGGIAGSEGVPQATADMTISLPYNDSSALEDLFAQRGGEIAGVIVEPAAANMGVIPPKAGFLESIREITSRYGAVLIFDEVITGFRIARGGACELYGIEPDLICLGKIIGGGLPIGAVCGGKDIMELLAPTGGVYQAGTLSGNPISVAAGIATLRELNEPGVYEKLRRNTEILARGLKENFDLTGVPATVNAMTGLLTVFFTGEAVTDYASALKCDMNRFARFHAAMLKEGIYLPPSGFEAWFTSTAHGQAEIEATLQIQKKGLGYRA